MQPDDRAREIAGWKLDEATWRTTVIDPYRAIYAEYSVAFDASVPILANRLGGARGQIATRPHYAGDSLNGQNESRTRWVLPVMFASEVARAGDRPLDAVFVKRGDRWLAIANLDVVIRRHVDRLDHGCAVLLEHESPAPRCREIQWQVADAALRVAAPRSDAQLNDQQRFAHACSLAATLCAR